MNVPFLLHCLSAIPKTSPTNDESSKIEWHFIFTKSKPHKACPETITYPQHWMQQSSSLYSISILKICNHMRSVKVCKVFTYHSNPNFNQIKSKERVRAITMRQLKQQMWPVRPCTPTCELQTAALMYWFFHWHHFSMEATNILV